MDSSTADAAYCLDQVRRFDRDRYLTALFAAAPVRADLIALYAFNVEVAKTRELVREPMMGLMRLQWWRDCIGEIYAGNERRHQVAQPLAAAIRRHGLERAAFERLLEARERDLEEAPPANLPALVGYADATAGSLGLLAARALGGAGEQEACAVRAVWIAWALAGLLRAVPFHARHRRVHLPQDLLAQQGLDAHDVLEQRRPPALAAVVRTVAVEAGSQLAAGRALARALPRRLLPVMLLGTLAAKYLRQIEAAGHDVYAPGLQDELPGRIWRLLWADLRGRA
ncbi:MAG TPA: squalene/phytoene synthase family protein [Candidatus Acidoferrum sp.]|nr:squalene/phytoene synthase family protein [Candidatus Acidoferrum sp.]